MFDLLKNILTADPASCEQFGNPSTEEEPLYAESQMCVDDEGMPTGGSSGMGFANGDFTTTDGDTVQVTSGINEASGVWRDGEGDINRGAHLDASLLKVLAPDAWSSEDGTSYGGYEMTALDGVADASYDDGGTLGAGVQANLASAALTSGTRGTETDEYNRIGLSAGFGGAGRVHFGDADEDGHREYGFGFDAGPVSLDVKSEDPLRRALEIGSFGMWDGDRDEAATRSNMTEGAIESAGALVDDVRNLDPSLLFTGMFD